MAADAGPERPADLLAGLWLPLGVPGSSATKPGSACCDGGQAKIHWIEAGPCQLLTPPTPTMMAGWWSA
jgi:hypothetical protein